MANERGMPLPDWQPPGLPGGVSLQGRFVDLVPLDPERDAPGLLQAFDGADHVWDFMAGGPYPDAARLSEALATMNRPAYTVFAQGGSEPLGFACFWTNEPAHGVTEIGNITFGPALQRSAVASEALMLMIAQAFAIGYRRVEWKCNALNLPSRRAAVRLGFSYEGLFRQHMVLKGRNRDTAWFAMTDQDWPAVQKAHAAWLDPANFDASGQQRTRLSDLTAPLLLAHDPLSAPVTGS